MADEELDRNRLNSIATVSISAELPKNWWDRQGGLETEEYPRQGKELVGFFK
ncbi:hypothetical protein GOC69_31475 [Sinorhizobium medicae]|nr:hypothetical protein [Sinorhizobium medicae]MDX0476259.1 hypothetical protein [Sinorhizobium medicae]